MSKKISELTEAVQANNNDLIMIVQNGVNKKITADKIGTGQGGGDTLPIGTIMPYTSDTIPNGWLLCDGSPFSASEYPELFDLIGVTYGWDENRNPLLPDMRGRVVVGKKAATSVNDTEFNALGKTGGEKAHTLTIDEMPSHMHDIMTNANWNSLDRTYGYLARGSNGTDELKTGTEFGARASGGSQPHNNLQPYIVTNFIIKAKQVATVLSIEDSLPIGTILDYDGLTVPEGYQLVNDSITIGSEFKTGRVIGNKEEYGKIITVSELPNNDEVLYASGINISNIEITNLKGIAKATNNTTFPLPFASAISADNNIQLNLRQNNQEYYIVIHAGRDRRELSAKVEINYLKN